MTLRCASRSIPISTPTSLSLVPMTAVPNILIVEDDEAIATGLALNLKIAGHVPMVVADGEQAVSEIADRAFELILLDLNLPKKDGLALMTEIRQAGVSTPIIVVSARVDEFDKVAALRLGADDYVTKPFSLAELMARVDAVLRRSRSSSQETAEATKEAFRFADVSIDVATRTVTRDGREVKMTRLEFELLSFLVRHSSRVFSREQLLRNVWGQNSGSPRTIDNFVAQLRAKLELDPERPDHFITVRGSGYRFDP